MAGGVIEPLVVFWNAWGIQAVVLLSFALQVTLLVTADLRRHRESRKLKVIIWTAYVLADTTAVYAFGHMSVMCGLSRCPEHGLTALWAPLLLVHLGGQDNITAYAIEDNKLWLRHLQIFTVQVVAAAYILYGSSVVLTRRTELLEAAILMFVVGVLKYGERVWALMRASSSASSSLSATSYNKAQSSSVNQHLLVDLEESVPTIYVVWADLLLVAYRLLDVPKQLFERPTCYVKVSRYYGGHFDGEVMLQVVMIQLEMMYDLLYTKAAVLHTWYGWCIRAISLQATMAALLLFRFRAGAESPEGHHQYQDGGWRGSRTVDVAVTYVLLGGAVVLDAASLLRAVCSRWTYVHLREGKWRSLASVVGCLGRRLVSWPETTRSISSMNMGQHTLCSICARSRNSTSSKVARWMGRDDWWDSRFHSWFTPISPCIIDKVVELVSIDEDITDSWGRNALRRRRLTTDDAYMDLKWTLELELDESILVWHIATQAYLVRRQRMRGAFEENVAAAKVLNATEALSNYFFFLLAARPNMLPYPVSRQRYGQLCYNVITHFSCKSAEDLAEVIGDDNTGFHRNATLSKGLLLARRLCQILEPPNGRFRHIRPNRRPTIIHEFMLGTFFDVWVELLCSTAYQCNENSHAKHLTTGGELMTTVALLMLYNSCGVIKKESPPPPILQGGGHKGCKRTHNLL